MSYLLYCIFRSTRPSGSQFFLEFKGQQVFAVSHDGLSVALSELGEPVSVAGISDLLAYEKIVEFYFREHTVLPFRFGCQIGETSEAVALLAERQGEYERLLEQLDGLGEMGVHVLPDEAGAAGTPKGSELTNASQFSASSGAAYLAAKRALFLNQDQHVALQRRLADSLCDSLSGYFVRRKIKPADSARSPLLSLYFLVRRERVEDFQQAASRFKATAAVKVLVSGPWPPFNFVEVVNGGRCPDMPLARYGIGSSVSALGGESLLKLHASPLRSSTKENDDSHSAVATVLQAKALGHATKSQACLKLNSG